VARTRDLAARLRVKPASATGALRALERQGLINYQPYEPVTLTKAGRRAAKSLATRHHALARFFTDVLEIKGKEATDVACRMEHFVPDRIIQRFVKFVEFTERCPRCRTRWTSENRFECSGTDACGHCENCSHRTRG